MNKSMINKEINILYRHLGKDIFDNNEKYSLTKKQKKIINTIKDKINLLEKTKEIEDNTTIDNSLPKDAIILQPEVNEDGLMVYTFCDVCHSGNNPKSTHCINCYKPL